MKVVYNKIVGLFGLKHFFFWIYTINLYIYYINYYYFLILYNLFILINIIKL